MKIAKYQIEALVSEIRSKRSEIVNQEVKALSAKIDKAKLEKQIKSAVIDMKRFQAKYPDMYSEVFDYSIRQNKCDVSESLYKRMYQKEVEKINRKVDLKYPHKEYEVASREIVLASLGCNTFDQLKLKLGI
jgi:hypothetical protein